MKDDRRPSRRNWPWIVPLSLWAFGVPASAEPQFGQDRFSVRAGAFLTEFDTEVALTGPLGGAGIDLEDDLGLDTDQSAYRMDFTWRFAPRHRVTLGFYRFDRSALAIAERAIELDDPDIGLIEIDIGVSVEARLDWQLVPVSYAYTFWQSDRSEAAASIGAHWADLEFGIEAIASVNGNTGQFVSESESTSGPLPVFGLRLDHALTKKWWIGGHAQYFTLDYDDYSGDLLDLRLQSEYWLTDNVGIGLGYTWYDIDLTVDEGRHDLNVKYLYDGLEAYLAVRF